MRKLMPVVLASAAALLLLVWWLGTAHFEGFHDSQIISSQIPLGHEDRPPEGAFGPGDFVTDEPDGQAFVGRFYSHPKRIRALRHVNATPVFPEYRVTGAKLQWSDDGLTWRDSSDEQFSETSAISLTPTAHKPHRYWRFLVTRSGSHPLTVINLVTLEVEPQPTWNPENWIRMRSYLLIAAVAALFLLLLVALSAQSRDSSGIRRVLLGLAVPLLGLILSVLYTSRYDTGPTTPWIEMTSPYQAQRPNGQNSILGYSVVGEAGRLIHRENLPSYKQVAMLVGGGVDQSFYGRRPVFPFLASMLFPVLGASEAFWVTNLVLWSVAILCAFLLARDVSRLLGGKHDLAAGLVAAALALLGSGFWFHLEDFSAHLTSFALYYVGVYGLFRSGVWTARKGVRTHATIAAFLSVYSLAYNSAIYLLAVYVVSALLARNRLFVVACATAAVFMFNSGWTAVLDLASRPHSVDHSVEAAFLRRALENWSAYLSDGSLLRSAGKHVFEFVTASEIWWWLIALCTLAALAFRDLKHIRLYVLLSLVMLMPLALALVWAPAAGARGYLVYGGSVGLYCLAAQGVSCFTKRWARYASAAVIAAACCTQLVWLSAYPRGNLVPIHVYFLGADDLGVVGRALGRSPGFLATLTERSPGKKTALAAGGDGRRLTVLAAHSPEEEPELVPVKKASLLRGYVAIPIVVCLVALHRRDEERRQRGNRGTAWSSILGLFLFLVVIPPIAALGRSSELGVFDPHEFFLGKSPQRVRLEIRLSADVVRTLQSIDGDAYELELFTGLGANSVLGVEVFVGEVQVGGTREVGPHPIPVSLAGFVGALGESRWLTVTAECSLYAGWQTNSDPERRLWVDGSPTDSASVAFTPSVELRLRSRESGLVEYLFL